MTKLTNSKLLKSTTSFKLLFTIALAVLVPIVLTLAGCKGGGAATMPTIKPTTTTKPTVKKPSTDLGTLAKHFAHKKYTGDTKQYTIDDIIAPTKIVSALTNTKISYIKLLRNEILARRGYVFKPEKQKLHGLKPEVIKEILQPTKWYTSNPEFIYADLNKIEIANVSFLKKLEKIDLIGGERARQLAVVLDMDKHEINTDEALMIFKITKDADVLTSLNPTADKLLKELIKYKGWNAGKGTYELQFGPDENSVDYSRKYTGIAPGSFYPFDKSVTASKLNELYIYGKFVLSLKEEDRIYLKGHNVGAKTPTYYVAEVYMNFPITDGGKDKGVPNWTAKFNWDSYLLEGSGRYGSIYSYEDGKLFMGGNKIIKEIDTKTKTVKDIVLSSNFQKTVSKYVERQMNKGMEDLPYDLCLYQERQIDIFNIAKFDDSEFYFLSHYRPDVRNILIEGAEGTIKRDIDVRPYKAEWTNDSILFKGLRLYRYIKVK